MARATGNETLLEYSGTWDSAWHNALGTGSAGSVPNPGGGPDLALPPLSTTRLAEIKLTGGWGDPLDPPMVRIYFDSDALFEPGKRNFGFVLVCRTGFGGGDYEVVKVPMPTSTLAGFDVSVPASGSWSLTLPVIEMEEEGTPDNSTDIHGSPFRYEDVDGFAAVADALPNGGVRRYQVPKPGATCTVTATAGSGSVSASSVIPGGQPPVDYALTHFLYCSAKNEAGGSASFAVEVFPNEAEPSVYSYDFDETATGVHAGVDSGGSGATVTADGSFTTATSPYYFFAESRLDGNSAPKIEYAAELRARALDQPYPAPIVANVLARNRFNPVTLAFEDEVLQVTLNPTGSLEWDQHRYQEVWGWAFQNVGFTYKPAVFKDDRSPVRVWLSAESMGGLGEDSRDGRMQISGYRWPALNLTWADRTVASSLSGDRSYSVPLAGENRYPYARYLEVVAHADEPRPLSVALGDASWSVGITGASATYRIDLAAIRPIETKYKDTRFPIDDPGGFPTNTPPTERSAVGWGVEFAEAIELSVPDGSLTVSSAKYVSILRRRLTLTSPFALLGAGWTSPSDVTTLQRKALLESDGRVVDWPGNALISPTTGADPYWRLYSIAEMGSMLGHGQGWSCAVLSGATDGYHSSAFPANLLGGAGATVVHGGGQDGQWTDWFDAPIGTIHAQDLWDQIEIYPGAPNPWRDAGEPYGERIRLRSFKSLRAQGTGLLFDKSGVVEIGATAELRRVSDEALRGTGLSDEIGYYATGSPWGVGISNHRLQRPGGTGPTFALHARMRHRATLGFPSGGKGLAYDVAPNARHYRALIDGTISVRATGNVAPFPGSDRVSSTEAKWIRIRADRSGRSSPLWAMFGDGETVRLAKTLDEGATFIDPMTIGSGAYGDFDHGANGQRWFYWVEGGGTIRYALYDAFMTLRASGATNVTDAAEEGQLAVRESVGPSGEWRMGLFYQTAGGPRSFLTAKDGKTFS